MVGLDAAGKTTILYKLKLGEVVTTIPDRFQRRDGRLQEHLIHGVGCRWSGQDPSPLEALLPKHPGPHLCRRLQRSRPHRSRPRELHKMINEDELRDAVILVFANKQDLPNAMTAAEVTDKLGLHSLRSRNWYIQATCATTGDGSTRVSTGSRPPSRARAKSKRKAAKKDDDEDEKRVRRTRREGRAYHVC